jgi:hypothetical protein
MISHAKMASAACPATLTLSRQRRVSDGGSCGRRMLPSSRDCRADVKVSREVRVSLPLQLPDNSADCACGNS